MPSLSSPSTLRDSVSGRALQLAGEAGAEAVSQLEVGAGVLLVTPLLTEHSAGVGSHWGGERGQYLHSI